MENFIEEYSQIKGWGQDTDPKNDPTYPMKHRKESVITGYKWERPALQGETVEILKSVERPQLSAVFGTSAPPKGLSGAIRRFAFKYSEGSFAHWIPLIVADRVNVVEGIIEDIRNGKFPNIFAEKGFAAQWKYNKKKVIQRYAVGAAITAGFIAYFFRRRIGNTLEEAL